MLNPDVMLEVSIAVGVLYVSLPAARYRDRLFDTIVAGFKAENDFDIKKAKPELEGLRNRDIDVSNDSFFLAMWLGELPPGRLEELEGTSADLFADATRPSDPPKLYLWFRANLDKISSAALCVAIPIAMRWLSSWFPEIFSRGCYDAVLVLGQLFVGTQVILGIWMVRQQSQAFMDKLRQVVSNVKGVFPNPPNL